MPIVLSLFSVLLVLFVLLPFVPIMVTRVSNGPSAHTIPSQASEGLSSPDSELAAALDIHIHPSQPAHVPGRRPALHPDFDFGSPRHDPVTVACEFEEFISSGLIADTYDFPWIGELDPPQNGYNDQLWSNNLERRIERSSPVPLVTSSEEISQYVTHAGRARRTVPSCLPSGYNHKRRKIAKKSPKSPPVKQSGPSTYYQQGGALGTVPWSLEAFHNITQPPEPLPATVAMVREVEKSKRSLHCAFRKAQAKLGLPYTCTAAPVTTVSAVRTHLTRKLPEGKPPHLPFLKLCRTCNEDILDETEFETSHGKDGLKCETPRQQRKGDAGQQEQYDILCLKVEAYIATQVNRQASETAPEPQLLGTCRPQHTTRGEHLGPSGFEQEAPRLSLSKETLYNHSDALEETWSSVPMSLDRLSPETTLEWEELYHSDDPWTPVCGSQDDRLARRRQRMSRLTHTLCGLIMPPLSASPPVVVPIVSSEDSPGTLFGYKGPIRLHGMGTNSTERSEASDVTFRPGIRITQPEFVTPQCSTQHSTSYVHVPPSTQSYPDYMTISTDGRSSTLSSSIASQSTILSSSAASSSSSILSDVIHCPLCPATFEGAYRKGNYGRHRRQKHLGQAKEWCCECKHCDKMFLRADARLKHYRSKHPELIRGL